MRFSLVRIAGKQIQAPHSEQGFRIGGLKLHGPLKIPEGFTPILLLQSATGEQQVRADMIGVEFDDIPSLNPGL
jgi:hypothetical protein